MKLPVGTIISGSLTEGLVMRIAPHTPLETIKTGKFLSIKGTHFTFFSLITDLSLQVTHGDILLFPPTSEETLLADMLQQRDIYALSLIHI